MPLKSYHSLIKELEKGLIAPLYLFYGEETYLIDEVIKKISSLLIDPNLKDFNCRIGYADEENSFNLIDEAKTLPFMGDKRLLVIKNIERLKKGDDEAFIRYCLNPSFSSCVIFIGVEIDKRRKFFHVLSKEGVIVRPMGPKAIRVTIGLPGENKKLTAALRKVLDIQP